MDGIALMHVHWSWGGRWILPSVIELAPCKFKGFISISAHFTRDGTFNTLLIQRLFRFDVI
jgi:hypothetical protein